MAERERGRPDSFRDRAAYGHHNVTREEKAELPPDIAAVAQLLGRVRARIILEDVARDGPTVARPVPAHEEPRAEAPKQLLLRVDDVAAALSIGRSKVYELMRSGELPSIHIGRSVRVSVDDVQAWIRQKRAGG